MATKKAYAKETLQLDYCYSYREKMIAHHNLSIIPPQDMFMFPSTLTIKPPPMWFIPMPASAVVTPIAGSTCVEGSFSNNLPTLPNLTPQADADVMGEESSIYTIPAQGALRLNKFVRRLHEMLVEEQAGNIIEWRKGVLVIHSTSAFTKQILPKYFNTRTFKTFRRQLNYYGFVHVRSYSTIGSNTTALWVNQELAKKGSSSISSVLLLRRVSPCPDAKTAEGRRVRKEEAFHTIEDIELCPRSIQLDHVDTVREMELQQRQPFLGGKESEQHPSITPDTRSQYPTIISSVDESCHSSKSLTSYLSSSSPSAPSSSSCEFVEFGHPIRDKPIRGPPHEEGFQEPHSSSLSLLSPTFSNDQNSIHCHRVAAQELSHVVPTNENTHLMLTSPFNTMEMTGASLSVTSTATVDAAKMLLMLSSSTYKH